MKTQTETYESKMPPIHPGEILDEEFMRPMNVTVRGLAKSIGVDRREIRSLVDGTRPVTAELANSLARHFGTSAAFWSGMQHQHDRGKAQDDGTAP